MKIIISYTVFLFTAKILLYFFVYLFTFTATLHKVRQKTLQVYDDNLYVVLPYNLFAVCSYKIYSLKYLVLNVPTY